MAITLPKLKSYIPVDLLRNQNETLDITDFFKGRVGDVNSYVKLWVYSNGLTTDLTGCRVLFQGTDHEHNDFRSYLKFADDQKLDNIKVGRVTLYFDDNIFQVEGQWEQAFFSFIDPKGNVVSTVNVLLNVLGNNVYARMGIHAKSVIAEFDDLVKKLSELVDKDSKEANDKVANLKENLDKLANATEQDFNEWLTKYKQALTDAMAEISDPKTGLKVLYADLLDTANNIQKKLEQAQFHDRPFQLKTVTDMKAYTPLMAGDEVITQGWDNYDDGHGAYWNIRVKHKNETPDENNVISLDNGMVAERNSSLVSADSLEDLMYGYSIKIVHNQDDFPVARVFYYEDAIGTETNGFGTGANGLGATNVKCVPCEVDYPDVNTAVVRIPRNFYLEAAPQYDSGVWHVIDGNRTIEVSLGNVDDAKAKSGDTEGRTYLSAGTGYFSKPTSPSDLRATYIDQHTQRLDWRY